MAIIKRLKNIGPGAFVAAAFIGPGTVTSCAVAGSSYGYTLLWAIVLSIASVIVIQIMSARIGVYSNKSLGVALRDKFTNKYARIFLAIIVVAATFIGNIAYETGNITGSVLGLQLISDSISGEIFKWIFIAALGIIAFALLWSQKYTYIEKFLVAIVAIMGFVFIGTAIASHPNWKEVLMGMISFTIPEGYGWFSIATLMGTTVVPYNLYLHVSSAAEKWGGSKNPDKSMKDAITDTIISIVFGGFISLCIIICAAATLHVNNIEISSGAEMSQALSPLLGEWSSIFFGVGLFASGISSTITAPLAAAYACTGIMGWKDNLRGNNFKFIWIVVLSFGLFMSAFLGASPTRIILFAQAANALLLPISSVLILIIANDKKQLNGKTNSAFYNIISIIVILIFIFIAVRNFSSFFDGIASLIG